MKLTKVCALAGLFVGSLSITACGNEPDLYNVSGAAAKQKLANAQATYSELDCDKIHTVKSEGWEGDILTVKLSSTGGKQYDKTCMARLEIAGEGKVRITPDCSEMRGDIGETLARFSEMEVDEFVMASLADRPIDAEMIARRRQAIAAGNYEDVPEGVFEHGHGPTPKGFAALGRDAT